MYIIRILIINMRDGGGLEFVETKSLGKKSNSGIKSLGSLDNALKLLPMRKPV